MSASRFRKTALELCAISAAAVAADVRVTPPPSPDPSGLIGTVTSNNTLDTGNPFFQTLGTNGRSCATCHVIGDAWTVSARDVQARFNSSDGTDPIFRTNDGANCDNLDVSTVEARRSAYSLLLNKGLIRIALDVPSNAEFYVSAADNPYGCNSTTTLSMYRRPLPATNLSFLTTVMWDGRESFAGNTLDQNLAHQALDATAGHAQGSAPADAQLQQIVAFEKSLFTAQVAARSVGALNAEGGGGGPVVLSGQEFFAGINDPFGTVTFDPDVFTLFSAWLDSKDPQRASVARGENLFNNKPLLIQGVAGLNDLPGLSQIRGTCTTCHNAPNVGDHSVPLAINIGVSDASLRTADMPLFTLVNVKDAACIADPGSSGCTVQTMDPGRAMVTGKWADIGKTKGPILRGLAARAPYFHNGSAATLSDVVNFYDTRFAIGLTDQEKTDLVNFLGSL